MSRSSSRSSSLLALGPVVFAMSLVIVPAESRADHLEPAEFRAPQVPPISLGTSGSLDRMVTINETPYCLGGTLGALVQDDGANLYVLGNNHVIGDFYGTELSNEIIQPSILEEAYSIEPPTCPPDSSATITPTNVATFSEAAPIRPCTKRRGLRITGCPDNSVDAAIAQVQQDKCGIHECIETTFNGHGVNLDIGPLGNNTVEAAIGMSVQKDGRTTGHTRGTVGAIDVDIRVFYGSSADGLVPELYAQFVGQIRVDGGGFSGPGDSGSVVFECVEFTPGECDADPPAVGLLFAGSDSQTFLNPINTVLTSFSQPLAMAGCVGSEGSVTPGDETCFPNDGGGDGGSAPPPKNCGKGRNPPCPEGTASVFGLDFAREVRVRRSAALFDIPGVLGSGVGLDADGEPVIEIYMESPALRANSSIPAEIEGVPTRVIVTGLIRGY